MIEPTSRVARQPVVVPKGVEIDVQGQRIDVKGPKGSDGYTVHDWVEVLREDEQIRFAPRRTDREANAMAGTMRSLLNNIVRGVSEGFEKKLVIRGVGYRAQMQGNSLHLTLGFSHPVNHPVPEGIEITTPSQTEVVVRGSSKQRVGQTAAEIRAYRPPEPYKGKGVRYDDEEVIMKEAKKK
ncbi:MAG: 50S ribosomal protein L6 [Halofilum sp. (in: g-proteobacteria)]